MLELANHNMVDALRVISVERGIDPREFALVAFGGAGGLHAAEIARMLGIGTRARAAVPRQHVRLRAADRRPAHRPVDDVARPRRRSPAAATVNGALVPLRAARLETLRREGFAGEPEVEQRLEMRYFGQNYHREILVAGRPPFDGRRPARGDRGLPRGLRGVLRLPAAVGGRRDRRRDGRGLEPRRGARPRERSASRTAPPRRRTRPVCFGADGFLETPILSATRSPPGDVGEGPLIVEEALSTTVVPPRRALAVHESGSLLITIDGADVNGRQRDRIVDPVTMTVTGELPRDDLARDGPGDAEHRLLDRSSTRRSTSRARSSTRRAR